MSSTNKQWSIVDSQTSLTGPTTVSGMAERIFCGGDEWPYLTIHSEMRTIALVPAPAQQQPRAMRSEPIPDSCAMQANADLIAAAPDLLTALKALVDTIENPDHMAGFLMTQACAAIAKAEPQAKERP